MVHPQAFIEWVPVRGASHDKIDLAACHRTFQFGDLATLVSCGGGVGGDMQGNEAGGKEPINVLLSLYIQSSEAPTLLEPALHADACGKQDIESLPASGPARNRILQADGAEGAVEGGHG